MNDSGTSVILDSLLSFEPYADLGEANLCELLCSHCSAKLSEEFISKIAFRVSNKPQAILNVFESILLPLAERASLDAASSPLYRVRQVLKIWRDGCVGIYQCLREKLDQFSVFAGRIPLVSCSNRPWKRIYSVFRLQEIAGVSCESSSQLTDCSDAAAPEIATAMEYGQLHSTHTSVLLLDVVAHAVVFPANVDMLAELLSEVAPTGTSSSANLASLSTCET